MRYETRTNQEGVPHLVQHYEFWRSHLAFRIWLVTGAVVDAPSEIIPATLRDLWGLRRDYTATIEALEAWFRDNWPTMREGE